MSLKFPVTGGPGTVENPVKDPKIARIKGAVSSLSNLMIAP